MEVKSQRNASMEQLKANTSEVQEIEKIIYTVGCKLKAVMEENDRFQEVRKVFCLLFCCFLLWTVFFKTFIQFNNIQVRIFFLLVCFLLFLKRIFVFIQSNFIQREKLVLAKFLALLRELSSFELQESHSCFVYLFRYLKTYIDTYLYT